MKLNRTGSNWDRLERNKINENWAIIEKGQNQLSETIDDLVLESGGDSNLEVVQARGGKPTLNSRLNELDSEIHQKASKGDVIELKESKADKTSLEFIAESKRDKTVEIEMKDLSQDVKEAMTGGSVAVVGEDAIGSVNLKDNAVESRNLHKNYRLHFPYFADDTFDLDFFWEDKTVIVSGNVKNNPFGTGCQVSNFRGKTLENNNNLWITQFAIVYGSGTVYNFGEGLYRHLRVNESTNEITRKGIWRPFGVDKVTSDMMDKNYTIKGYLSDGTFDLNEIIEQGNYMVNANVKNNPYSLGCTLSVDRFKTDFDSNLTTVIQTTVCYASSFNRKYLGRIAVRVMRIKESTNEVDMVGEWSDGRDKPLKILSISNSFGLDTTNYIHEIAKSADVNLISGNLYISGGYFEDHYDNIVNNNKAYRYDLKSNVDRETTDTKTSNVSIDEALSLEDWDYVFFNQASAQSGVYDTFQPYLNDIISLVKDRLPDVKIALMPTWAYSSDFDDSRFDQYDRDQITMYNAILDAYKSAMSDVDFDVIIPAGTAIQNARTDFYMLGIDDELTRDGYHLGVTGGYVAGLTFFKTFFKNKKVNWKPSEVDRRSAYFGEVAAENAVLNPFKITEV